MAEQAMRLKNLADLAAQLKVEMVPLAAGPSAGLFESFRVITDPPHRDRVLYVFPYLDKGWHRDVERVFDFEQRAWTAFWDWISKGGNGRVRHRIPLLSTGPAVTRPELRWDTVKLPALLRPMVEWPCREHGIAEEDAPAVLQQQGLEELLRLCWRATGEPDHTLDKGQLSKIEPWALLSNGEHTVPTQFRFFHREYKDLAPW